MLLILPWISLPSAGEFDMMRYCNGSWTCSRWIMQKLHISCRGWQTHYVSRWSNWWRPSQSMSKYSWPLNAIGIAGAER